MIRRVYLDSGALIAVARGGRGVGPPVYDLVDDPQRAFVSSVFVRLEVLPKALFHRRSIEVALYRGFFDRVVAWAEPNDALFRSAEQEAQRHGLNALDALHVASAIALGADELVTTERPTKPIHRATGVAVVAV